MEEIDQNYLYSNVHASLGTYQFPSVVRLCSLQLVSALSHTNWLQIRDYELRLSDPSTLPAAVIFCELASSAQHTLGRISAKPVGSLGMSLLQVLCRSCLSYSDFQLMSSCTCLHFTINFGIFL